MLLLVHNKGVGVLESFVLDWLQQRQYLISEGEVIAESCTGIMFRQQQNLSF